MTLKNYFKIKIDVFQKITKDSVIDVTFQYIKMHSDNYSERKTLTNRKIYCLPETNSHYLYLLIQNDSNIIDERIDYLMDEEWDIQALGVTINIDKKPITNYVIEESVQVDSMEWYGQDEFLKNKILNFEEVDNTICILGPKPDKMFGYNMNDPKYESLIKFIMDKLETMVQYGKNIVLTNGYIGGEMLGYEAAKRLKSYYPEIINVVAVPFLELDSKWVINSRNAYRRMMTEADIFMEIDKVEHYQYYEAEKYAKEKFIKKNDFNIDHASAFLIIDDYSNSLFSFEKRASIENKSVDKFYYDDAVPFNF